MKKIITILVVVFVALFIIYFLFPKPTASQAQTEIQVETSATMPLLVATRTVPQVKVVTPLKTAPVASKQPSTASCEAYRELLEQYDWNVEIMMGIAKAESTCDPTRNNLKDKHATCTGSYGLLQIGCLHYKQGEDKTDINLNIEKAHELYKERGYKPWTTYTSGLYLK